MTNKEKLVKIIEKWLLQYTYHPEDILAEAILKSIKVCSCWEDGGSIMPEEMNCPCCQGTGIVITQGEK